MIVEKQESGFCCTGIFGGNIRYSGSYPYICFKLNNKNT